MMTERELRDASAGYRFDRETFELTAPFADDGGQLGLGAIGAFHR
jgi:hypothetical protein